MDIEKCYDSVDWEKLTYFLKNTKLIAPDFYILKCQVLKRKNNIVLDSSNFRRKKELKHYFWSRY